MRTKRFIAGGIASLTLLATACGGSTTTTPNSPVVTPSAPSRITASTPLATTPANSATPTTGAASTTPTVANSSPTTAVVVPVTSAPPAAVNPNIPEVVEPGDIPDNQVFVAFRSTDGSYTIKVPEGWARTESNGIVTFSDKYNSIAVQSMPSTTAPSVASVKATGLTDVAADSTFALTDVVSVTRKAGVGVVATYTIGSATNPVTGKKALLAVERYVFAHNGTTVVLTLSGAKGADNVDPWKTVTNSLSWN